MRLALRAARRASGTVFPNPPVGAVVYRGERVLGRGSTQPPPGRHAEIVALDSARRRHGAAALRGASLAVTLEPCCHRGRTGPCTRAIRDAGISRVAIGHRDPHPKVSGGGVRALRRAGLRVTEDVLAENCREQHRGFISLQVRGRPFVALKLAATLDGRIATRAGESRWITGEAARARVQSLRARADAIGVGSVTARTDDPELAVRRGGRLLRRPVRVVFDSALRLPIRSRLVREQPERTWVLCTRRAPARRRDALENRGVRILTARAAAGHLDLAAALRELGRAGLTDLLIEGGGGLAGALLRAELVDELHWFAAPTLLGGDAVPVLSALHLKRLADRLDLDSTSLARVGRDFYVRGRLSPEIM
ncbi:MAG: bifunctional diaminohydroxyphosphoribosylaminopyrimidine deaminase/5-amino-6-(5-phosphoribosylamino)uracil reductase RibD [Myxococcales bacterium]|nr:bifunctional diaminohydroxyphosphoribosylaminopyrimidine deaminase/5-amino-6-(5-phosphoribosylamino)uracil reductase RibD [Myxococcales bacterium]